MKPIVFAGPSLHGATSMPASVDQAAPAGCGDIMQAVLAGRRAIGLIDGRFESSPAVWHKEILFALDAGCVVYGAASMGALRAAECHEFGMIGIGTIFEDYLSGSRTADADVALVHGPAEFDYIPLSVPLVDVDDVMHRGRRAGIVSDDEAGEVRTAAGGIHFKLRTWDTILEGASLAGDLRSRITAWVAASGPAVKARDAVRLIDEITGAANYATASQTGFEHTQFSSKLLESVKG